MKREKSDCHCKSKWNTKEYSSKKRKKKVGEERKTTRQKIINKMAVVRSILSVITLNTNELNPLIKTVEWLNR